MALGPVLCGVLLSAFSWPAIFVVNLPIVLAAILLTAAFVPESRAPRSRRVDPVGQLMIAALATLTYAIIAGFDVILLALSLGCAIALVHYELHRRDPLLELRFFRSAPLAGASAIAVCLSAALGGFLFMTSVYLRTRARVLAAGRRALPAAHGDDADRVRTPVGTDDRTCRRARPDGGGRMAVLTSAACC